jgi:hypothetical protein
MKDPICEPCAAWGEKLAALHPDDLSPSEYAECEAHVANCLTCSSIRAEYRLMDARIRDFPSPEFLISLFPPPLKLFKSQDSDFQYS